ncbi:MAG: hypothetical protein J3R72DRAFT_493168 [Linnemannia gamsii]|nr:MAG: hypothetical protein J3R72DRAFT_493168 [Linnemannia gamsii]
MTNDELDTNTDTTFYQPFPSLDERQTILIPVVVVKSYGFKYHPGVVLDIVNGKKWSSVKKKNRSNRSSGGQTSSAMKTEHPAIGAMPVQDALKEQQLENETLSEDSTGQENTRQEIATSSPILSPIEGQDQDRYKDKEVEEQATKQFGKLIHIIGNYMMKILEMLKYGGVHVNKEREDELALVISRLLADVVHIIVPNRDGTREEIDSGMQFEHVRLTTAYQPKSGQQIAMAERKTRRVKIKAVVRVSYAARAAGCVTLMADFIVFRSLDTILITSASGSSPFVNRDLQDYYSFTWKTPSGSTKMQLDIACNQTDHVVAMFQWYCPLNEYLKVEGLSVEDAVTIEKLVRRKKKPLAPKAAVIVIIQTPVSLAWRLESLCDSWLNMLLRFKDAPKDNGINGDVWWRNHAMDLSGQRCQMLDSQTMTCTSMGFV